MPVASIIIITCNGRETLGPCLRSVLAQDMRGFEIILVDNGSTDGSAEMVSRRYPRVRVVRMGRNAGFAGGNNEGLRRARGKWAVMLNDDTVVEPNWLRELITPLERGEAELVSSRVYTRNVDPKFYEKNGSLSLLGYNIMRVFDDPEALFNITGCAAAFSRRLFPVPFDVDYFFYSEDVYLSLLARFKGYRIMQAPLSVVQHVGSSTTGKMQVRFITFCQERNRLLNLLLFFSGSVLLRLLPLVLLDFAAKTALAALGSLKSGKRRRKSLAGVLEAYAWLATHGSLVRAKRRDIQRQKRVRDEAVLSWMSCKFVNGEGLLSRLANLPATIYCALVGLRTVEFKKAAA